MALSSRDYRQILDVIDIVYSTPDACAMFNAVCQRLENIIHICGGVGNLVDSKTGGFCLGGNMLYNQSEGTLCAYLAHFTPQDPFITSGWFKKSFNKVRQNTDIMPARALMETGFARDFLAPIAGIFYCLAATLTAQGDTVGTIGLLRQKRQGEFTVRHKDICDCILPHMAMHIRNQRLMRGLSLTNESCGMIMVDGDGRPLYINEAARLIMRNAPVSAIPDPGVGAHPVFFRGNGVYRVRTVPFARGKRGRFILLEGLPEERGLYRGLTRFGLSPREKEVCVLTMSGLPNREIAQRVFITEQTVKDHLHNVFKKMDIHRRSELWTKAQWHERNAV
ncbi:MAG: helix-turn-helix transcriptional regulator [Deltaproteobacteria bacterium]|nr:helix-turn-helix transcriptional regulator [Deltaproteobacteria bacterium]